MQGRQSGIQILIPRPGRRAISRLVVSVRTPDPESPCPLANVRRMSDSAFSERDSPRDQLVVTFFLLTVFALLLGAGIKGRMLKAGFDTSLPWNTSRRWWEVCYDTLLNFVPRCSPMLIHPCYVPQAWTPQRQPEDIGLGETSRSRSIRDSRGAYVSVSDSPPNA